MALLNFLRDVFDANTEEDQRKRLARGEERYYKDQQKARGNKRPAENLAEQVAGHTLRFLNTAAAGARGAAGLAEVAGASVFGNDEDYNKTVNKVNERLNKDLNPDSGLFGAGTMFDDAKQAENISPLELARKTVGGALGVGSEVIPGGRVAKGATLAQRAGRGVLEGAAGGAAGNLGSQLVEGGDVNLGDVAKGAAFGGVVGGATPVAIAAGKDIAKTTKQIAADERGSIGAGEAASVVPEKKLSFLAAEQGVDTTSSVPEQLDNTPNVAPGKRNRGFLQSVQKSDTAPAELKQKVGAIQPQTYDVRHNPELFSKAKDIVDNSYGEAVSRIDSTPDPVKYDEDVAIGLQLMSKATREGRIDDAVKYAESLDIKGRDLGRGVQAFAGYSRLTPEGMLIFAQKQVRKSHEQRGYIDKLLHGDKQQPTLDPEAARQITDRMQTVENLPGGLAGDQAQMIQQAVEKPAGVASPNQGRVQRAVKQSIKAATKEPETVGEKVAKKVANAVTPPKRQAVDQLVAELSSKIKKDILVLPKPKQASATTILQEVLKRNQAGREALPEVKSILREKFANNEQALAALDKLFKTEGIDIAASSGTVNRAIAEQLKAKEVTIGKIIYDSLSKQGNIIDDVAQALVGEGIDEQTATAFAKDVAQRLNTQMSESKTRVLQQMMKDAPPAAKKTLIDKINKLSNLGALDNIDYIDLARAKLNLPALTPEAAQKISALSQQLQDNPNLSQQLTKEVMEIINEQIPVGFSEKFDAYRYQNILSNPRTQMRNTASNLFQTMVTRPATLAARASTDWFGATLFGKDRQYYAKEVPTYYKGLFNSIGDAIEGSKLAWKGDVPYENPDLTALHALRSKKIPKGLTVVSRFMEAQDRFFSTLIASGEYAAQKSKGVSDEAAAKEAEKVAQYSLFRQAFDPTNATGQGTLLSSIDKVSDTVTKFGAKHKAFRWFVPFIRTPMNATKQMVEYSPLGFATMPGANNKTEQLSKAMAGSMLAMIGAKLALDGETTWDAPKDETERQLFYESGKRPYSIKIGDKWVPMIYFGPYSLAFALPAAAKSANDRAPIDATTEEKLGAAIQNSLKYFSQQTYVQGIANIVDLVSGQSAGGSKNLGAALGFTAGQAIPLQGLLRYVAGVFDPTIRQSSNFLESIQAGIPGMSQGLEPYQTLAGNESRRNITDYVAPYTLGLPPGGEDNQRVMKANSDFLRTLRKTSRPRTRANEEINKAIQENDMEKAYKIARDYNESLKQAFSGWREKYGDQATNADLVKQYRDQKIRLNRSSIAQRRYTQKAKSKYQRSLVNA